MNHMDVAWARQTIMQQGDPGSTFYVILVGSFYVQIKVSDSKNLKTVAHLQPGDSFGEAALISDNPRNATVVSAEPSELLVIEKVSSEASEGASSKKVLLRLAERARERSELEEGGAEAGGASARAERAHERSERTSGASARAERAHERSELGEGATEAGEASVLASRARSPRLHARFLRSPLAFARLASPRSRARLARTLASLARSRCY
jgi:CRP-like cAMP-binding protein